MKLFWTSAAALLVLAFLAMPVSAQAMWSVSAEALASLSLHDEDVSRKGGEGYSVGLITPFHVGVGYDKFDFEVENADETGDASYEIMSLIVRLPVEMMNVAVAYGEGTIMADDIDFGAAGKLTFDDTSVRKAAFHFGVPLAETFDLRVSYHDIIAEPTEGQNPDGSEFKTELFGADALTAGVAVHF